MFAAGVARNESHARPEIVRQCSVPREFIHHFSLSHCRCLCATAAPIMDAFVRDRPAKGLLSADLLSC
jgi:hypothetical protein